MSKNLHTTFSGKITKLFDENENETDGQKREKLVVIHPERIEEGDQEAQDFSFLK